MLLSSSAAFADQAIYTDSGGSFTLGSSINVSAAAVASPTGTLSLSCPVTSTTYGTYLWQYFCSGGTITMQSNDGLTILNGTFTSGTLSLTASGGGRGGHTHYYYSFVGSLTGSLTKNSEAEAIAGGIYFNVAPLTSLIGSGSAPAGGGMDLHSVYGPIYVADTANNRIVRLDTMTGTNWQTLGAFGRGTSQFSAPVGIALDASGRIYVADTGNCRIVRMDNMTGANWTSWGACGAGTDKFRGPDGVAIDAAGRIYVADTGHNEIVRMDDMSGTNWTTLSTDPTRAYTLSGPRGLAFDAAGKIYIADTGNNRVVRVDDMTGANWTILNTSSANSGVHYTSVYGVALDPTGRIYVMDEYAAQVVRADDIAGDNWTTFGAFGGGVGAFINPYGIAVNPVDGGIYVADTQNGRIVRTTDLSTLDWVSLGSYGPGVDQFGGPQGIAAVPVTTPVPVAVLSAGSLTYGNQNVGTSSAPQTLTLTNIGGAPLEFSSITTSGDFSETNTCNGNLPGGSSCAFSVDFTPTATGMRNGSLNLNDNSVNGPSAAVLTGTGTAPVAAVTPSNLTFASQQVNTTSAALTVDLSNTGTGPLTINNFATSAGFAQTNNCGSSVAPGFACTISVTFTPTVSGAVTGDLAVSDNAGTQTVSLSGTGSSTAPNVTVSPAGVTFPAQVLNKKSKAQAVTLSNLGTTSITISSIVISGPYAETTGCKTSLAAGKTCTVNATFTPTATGTQTGSLTFNLSTGTQTVALDGIGTPSGTTEGLTVSPTSVPFGQQVLNDTQNASVTVTNTNGVVVGISGISMSGSKAFTQSNTCGTTLASGATCTVTVNFTATAYVTYTGTLSVTESSGASHKVSLSGAGVTGN
jgi:sugar lactone lactonase YvrE